MASYIKLASFLAVALIISYSGWATYQYFFSLSTPTVSVVGIEAEGHYAGKVTAVVKGYDAYKVARLGVVVDDRLIIDVKIGRTSFEYPFTLDTQDLKPGKHILILGVENGAYHTRRTTVSLPFYVNNTPLQAAFMKNESDAKIPQGRTLHMQFQTNNELKNASVKTLSKTYPCFRESDRGFIYECFIPIETEERPQEYLMTVEAIDLVGNKAVLEGKFQVLKFPFKKQTIKVDAEKMKAEREAGLSDKQFEAEIEALTKQSLGQSPCTKLWHGHFVTPIEVTDPKQITTEYGVIRTTQERGLSQHKAIDLYTTPKSVVWAPQSGVVVMKKRFAHSGNTIVIDHGCGILTLLFHLDNFAPLEVGDKISKGNPVGTLGKTGYATGYHVHWEMRVNNVAVDPMEWTSASF